jgi:hypothetical protein
MYYPLSQITTNLYTNGEEFVIAANNAPYKGYYWKTSQGKFFSGKTPQDTPIQKIIPVSDLVPSSPEGTVVYTELSYESPESVYYSYIKKPKYKPLQIPTYFLNIPTNKDYQTGEFRRYFCKKANELLYLEISKDTHDKLKNKDSSIYYQYYIPFNISWQLIGNKEQVYKTNRNVVELVSKNLKLSRFNNYLQNDFTKYYQ